jgi:hypothetical protein
MSHTLHICLGAHGDIIAMLPWMKMESERTGEPVRLLVASPYLPLLDGVSYVKAIEWGFKQKKMPGTFHQLHDARKFLKVQVPDAEVKVLQFYGSGELITYPSFIQEMWYQAGALMKWDKLPLVFDQRYFEREAKLCAKHTTRRPFILVATKGKSSPFKYAKELLSIVTREFGRTHDIIDLSKVVAEKPYDLLGLYDRAVALVTIDTMHAHLSRASEVPTFVWSRDYPNSWHGVPWEARYKFHARYSSFPLRKDEFVRRLREVVEGKETPKPVIRPIEGIPIGHYNPSMVPAPDGTPIISSRAHFNQGGMTKLWITFHGTLPIKIKTPKDVSHEDMRLFRFRGQLMASYVLARQLKNKDFRCVVEIAELVRYNDHWTVRNRIRPKIAGNVWSGKTKNVVFFEHFGQLTAFTKQDEIVTFSERGEIRSRLKQKGKWNYGEIRGGTIPLEYDDRNLIRFFHSRTADNRYHIGAMLLHKEILSVQKTTPFPILSGDERWTPGITHWKPNVVFPMGAVALAGGWRLSIGVNDYFCATVDITPEMLNL